MLDFLSSSLPGEMIQFDAVPRSPSPAPRHRGFELWRKSWGAARMLADNWETMWKVMTVLLGDKIWVVLSCELWVVDFLSDFFFEQWFFWSHPNCRKKWFETDGVEARIWPSDSESWFGHFAVALLIGLDHGNNFTPAKGSAGVMGDGDLCSKNRGGGWFIEVPNFYPYWDLPNL